MIDGCSYSIRDRLHQFVCQNWTSQFALRVYREKVLVAVQDHPALRERGVHLTEDLTFSERQQRRLLRPKVKVAREERKRAYFRGADAFIDGEKLSVKFQDEYCLKSIY